MKRVCPKCDIPLFLLHLKDIEIDFCDRCHGLWLDAGELEALLRRTGAPTDDPLLRFQQQAGVKPSGRQHLCPRCDEPLREIQVKQSGSAALTLDKCPLGHGLWFDSEELQRLLEMFPAGNGAENTIHCLNELFGKNLKH